jgi:hypothetical protein
MAAPGLVSIAALLRRIIEPSGGDHCQRLAARWQPTDAATALRFG